MKEHAIIYKLAGGYTKVIPETGYILRDRRSQRNYSQVVAKDIRPFEAVKL